MRLYTFINFYLSQIQQGIQSAHLVHELFNKYPYDSTPTTVRGSLWEWSSDHKTIIVCNAGADPQIQELINYFIQYEGIFPWADFVEDEGLCKARTGCGIVLPDWIYECEKKYESDADGRFKTPYYEFFKEDETTGEVDHRQFRPGDEFYPLIDIIKSKRLA